MVNIPTYDWKLLKPESACWCVSRREWMGCWGLLGLSWKIAMKWIIPSFPIWSISKLVRNYVESGPSRIIWGVRKVTLHFPTKFAFHILHFERNRLIVISHMTSKSIWNPLEMVYFLTQNRGAKECPVPQGLFSRAKQSFGALHGTPIVPPCMETPILSFIPIIQVAADSSFEAWAAQGDLCRSTFGFDGGFTGIL